MKAKHKKQNNTKDSLGDRMKKMESITRTFLIPKLYTIIRLDGCHFHTYTKKFRRPFDDLLINAMDDTARYLCSKIQGAQFAYVQSDEITIYLSDMDSIESQMWYDGNIQKITSVSASMATSKFNHIMTLLEIREGIGMYGSYPDTADRICDDVENMQMAEFDSRVFQLPNRHEVVNCILWRQQDCTRNSISSVAQSLYSPKELHGVNCNSMQELIFQKGINWNEYDPKLKRGRFIDKVTYVNDRLVEFGSDGEHILVKYDGDNEKWDKLTDNDKVRTKWVSREIPIITEDREFLLSRIK